MLVAVGVAVLRRSTLGSAMLAVRANERSAAAAGVNVVRVKVLSFALASFIAGLGGSLLAYRRGVVTFDSFTAIGGLSLLSTAYLAGITSVWGGLNAGILASSGITFIALDRWVDLGEWFHVISGVLLILTLINNPEGIAAAGHEFADRLAKWKASRRAGDAEVERPAVAGVEPAADRPVEPVPRRRRGGRHALKVDHLTVRYGGVVAVNDVSLRVDRGQDRRAHRAERRRQDERHRRGHRLRPLRRGPSSSAGGASTRSPPTLGCGPASPARSSRSSSTTTSRSRRTSAWRRSAVARPTAAPRWHGALDSVGISTLARPSGRRAEPGRAPARVDRPGLRRRPGGAAARRARRRARHRARAPGSASASAPSARPGTAMLLVDHDVNLVLSVCDHVYVLDFGAVIAEGPPDAIRADRAVADAYLGTMHDTEAVTA